MSSVETESLKSKYDSDLNSIESETLFSDDETEQYPVSTYLSVESDSINTILQIINEETGKAMGMEGTSITCLNIMKMKCIKS